MQHHIVITENLTPIYLTQKIRIGMEKIEHLKVGAILFWIPFGLKTKSKKQALKKYLSGDYTLGKLDRRGQRINIRVTIPRKGKSGSVSFITGWMLMPNGKLKLNTPYGVK